VPPGINNAQYAAEFRNLPKSFQMKAILETLDENNKKKFYETSLDISSRPLIDLYVNQWRIHSQDDYLRLTGFDPALESSKKA
jgi:transposase InsO family protein